LSEWEKIDERTFEFALEIVALYKYMIENKEYILLKQMLTSGTSIGANVQESQAAQSKADFISKMSIASKEARETKYWLRLLSRYGYLDGYSSKAEILANVNSIINIITKIVKTSSEKGYSSNIPTKTQNIVAYVQEFHA
jgi:four helix bundle protein